MDPRDALEDVREELQELLQYVSGYAPREIPEVFEQLSEHFSALGICKLLVSGEPDGFRFALTQSGYARRFLLHHLVPDTGQLHLGLNRSDALFDALAAGSLELAREIASMSTKQWLPTREYEEDFLYRRILGLVTLSGSDAADDAENLADRMEEVQGGSSTRLDLCRALVGTDDEAFRTAVSQLAGEYEEEMNARRPGVGEADYLFWPRSYVHIEALALLQLADLLGIDVAFDLPLCPPEARLDVRKPDPINLVEEAHRIGAGA